MTIKKHDLKLSAFTVATLLFISVNSIAEDLIKNKNFAEIGAMGLPKNFEFSGKGKTRVQWNNGVNTLEFDVSRGEIQILKQPSLPLKPGARYQLSWWIAGDKTVEYMIYIENLCSNKKGNVHNDLFSSGWRHPKTQWQKGQIKFVYNSKNRGLPYLAMQMKGVGKSSLKHLDLIRLDDTKTPKIDINKVATRSNGKSQVTSDTDNIIQVNGKPFFPIFVWGAPGFPITDNLFKQLKSNGINCFYSYMSSDSKVVLDLAQQYDIKVILAVPKHFWAKPDAVKLYHNVYEFLTPEVVNHPALFGYFLGDELLWSNMKFKPILQAYEFLKKIDPNHPVWLNEAPRNRISALAEYAQACDIYGVDIYPVGSMSHSELPERGIPSVGQYAKRFCEAVDYKKPICMTLQGFSWSVQTRASEPSPYPNRKQLRFMAYDSIINGSTMLNWWGLYCVDAPEFYDDLFSVTRELYQIIDILTGQNSKENYTCSTKSIEGMVKETPHAQAILTANTSPGKITAKFNTSIKAKKLYVLFENRKLDLENGVFNDSFEPYAVHVYSTQPNLTIKLPSDNSKTPCYFRQSAVKCQFPYKGKANWIWFPGKSNIAGSKCDFMRNFSLDEIPNKANLMVSADDTCTVKLNGKSVASCINWSKAAKVSVVAFLKKGVNVIEVNASDRGFPPCGMLFDLRMEFENSRIMSIVSDASWKCKENNNDNIQTAEIIVPYGGEPWGRNVYMPRKE